MNALWHSLGVQGIKYTIFYRHITSPLPSNGWGPRGEEYAEKSSSNAQNSLVASGIMISISPQPA